jgi:hypothetical protein
MYDILELNKKLLPELKEIAKQLNVKKADTLRKQDLIYKILDEQAIVATETKKLEKKPEIVYNSDHKRRGRRPRRTENDRPELLGDNRLIANPMYVPMLLRTYDRFQTAIRSGETAAPHYGKRNSNQ